MTEATVTSRQINRHRRSLLQRLAASEELWLVMVLGIFVAFWAWQSPSLRSAEALWDLLREVAPNIVTVIGVALLMLSGEFDLSVGSMLALVGVVTVATFNTTGSVLTGIAAGLATGLIVGALNGLMVTRFKMNSLIVTLSMLFALRGIVYVYTGKAPVVAENWSKGFEELYYGSLGPIPVPVIVAVMFFLVFQFILTQTPFGRNVYAIGGNPTAAGASGIRVSQLKFILFVTCSLLAAVSGLLMVAQTGTGYFDAGATGFEVTAIVAAVVGGLSLAGGEGTLVGAVIGMLILGVTSKGLRLMGVYTTWQLVATGVIMIIAIYAHQLRKRVAGHK